MVSRKLLWHVNNDEVQPSIADDIFGTEFSPQSMETQLKTETEVYGPRYWEGKPYMKIKTTKARVDVMRDFDRARVIFLKDSLFVASIGMSLSWAFGTINDMKSFATGSALGLLYALLLGRYVENLGERGGGGSVRFLPVILLIAVYGKFNGQIHILPELLGFFSYQVSSFLQIFNENLYDSEEGESVPSEE